MGLTTEGAESAEGIHFMSIKDDFKDIYGSGSDLTAFGKVLMTIMFPIVLFSVAGAHFISWLIWKPRARPW